MSCVASRQSTCLASWFCLLLISYAEIAAEHLLALFSFPEDRYLKVIVYSISCNSNIANFRRQGWPVSENIITPRNLSLTLIQEKGVNWFVIN